jgi:apolipoprotein D and lipocalin family protein
MLPCLSMPFRTLLVITALLLSACTGLPAGIEPVTGFDIDRYTGRWYEIARLDHSFERGLSQVTADYRLNDDGSVQVINRGFDARKGEWKEAKGRARFVGEADRGHLKVSFFGPFYGAYVIYELDHDDYQYAFITSYKRDFLWLLARTPQIDEAWKQRFVQGAESLGFATGQLIWVEHQDAP